jgi:hypothetical protein
MSYLLKPRNQIYTTFSKQLGAKTCQSFVLVVLLLDQASAQARQSSIMRFLSGNVNSNVNVEQANERRHHWNRVQVDDDETPPSKPAPVVH